MPNSGDGIRLRSSARTSVGQVRENNEDSVHLWTGDQHVLAVVADGMGGAAAGEEASQLAIEAIQVGMALRTQDGKALLDDLTDDALRIKLRDSIQEANLSIIQRADAKPDMKGMGTTVTLALIRGQHVLIAHVGDSRAYQVSARNQNIHQITSDHSFVEALLAAGHITPEQADEHPMRNVLYRALGQTEDVDIDVYDSILRVGDRLVLCSDGLTRHVKPHEIAQLALGDANPDVSSQKLIDLANNRGGEDNVSVIVVTVEQDAATQQGEADMQFAAEEDEDDTLVLKDNPIRSALNVETPPVDSETNDHLEAPPALSKQKMQAERISDGVITPIVDDPTQLTKGLIPPDPMTVTVRQLGESRESDGEGHDTRAPEQ